MLVFTSKMNQTNHAFTLANCANPNHNLHFGRIGSKLFFSMTNWKKGRITNIHWDYLKFSTKCGLEHFLYELIYTV